MLSLVYGFICNKNIPPVLCTQEIPSPKFLNKVYMHKDQAKRQEPPSYLIFLYIAYKMGYMRKVNPVGLHSHP